MKTKIRIIFLFSFFIPITQSAVSVYPTKIGETLILDIGKDVKEWKRIRNGSEESLKFCYESSTPFCNKWIDKNTNIIDDNRSHLFSNGTLKIERFQTSDSGDYFSNDELERIHYTTDGRIWKLARTRISVIAL